MRFRATIKQSGRTATGIRVPEEVVAALGSGKRPAVRVTIGGHPYRSTVAPMGGAFMIGVSAENRARAGVAAGDETAGLGIVTRRSVAAAAISLRARTGTFASASPIG